MWYQRISNTKYIDVATQKELRDPAQLERIREMHIPPAYTNVMISKSPRSKVQAFGYDSKGRKQIIYARWFVNKQAKKKFERIIHMDMVMPSVIQHVIAGLDKGDQNAMVMYLMIECGFRVGNDRYASRNSSYGLTTLQLRHVTLDKGRVLFDFIGKKNIRNQGESKNPIIYAYVKRRLGAGLSKTELLFPNVTSHTVNQFLRSIYSNITSKDIRTWNANHMFLHHIMQHHIDVKDAVSIVARHLHHTPAVCKSSYLHPEFLQFAVMYTAHNI